MVRNPPFIVPSEKRHSKPCRYYQTGSCALSAEKCNFAHVKELKLVGTPATKLPLHVESRTRETKNPQRYHSPLSQDPTSVARFPGHSMEEYPFSPSPYQYLSFPSPYAASRPPHYIPPQRSAPSFSPFSPINSNAPTADIDTDTDVPSLGSTSSPSAKSSSLADTYTDGDAPSPPRTPDAFTHLYSPVRMTTWPSMLSPSFTPHEASFYFVQPTIQDQMRGYGHGHGMQTAYVGPVNPYALSPVGYVTYHGQAVGHGFGGAVDGSKGNRERQDAIPVSKKARAYKTKQCKFFRKDGTCPKGDQCTFIHERRFRPERPPQPRLPSPTTPTTASPLTSTSTDSTLSSSSLRTPTTASSVTATVNPPELPQKPLSSLEEMHAKGLFPITWRVIGGGVTLGGRREVCPRLVEGHCPDGDDCRFFHPDPDELPYSSAPVSIDPPFEDDWTKTPKPHAIHSPSLSNTTSTCNKFSGHSYTTSLNSDKQMPGKPSAGLSIAIPAQPNYLPDVSPTIFRGQVAERLGMLRSTIGGINGVERPHSTPPSLVMSPGRVLSPVSLESPYP
ncbi:uncharacterized protein STEHIDRAFT_121928 [Stereum hirsutum FP-91666 SS1]|uniref:uncharacterized protein n=1 Tax=Stereum hirsutum (strain FP-91666) TaxID=721885 RepID=UPI0004449522|nr:uncharacterized protein STEHIDRAFT_121928 [Stereum hirsutum FP-91666 SS1]EIM85935.1 hypothetical protein STEHIDRAFT_121928 [Stereum hirsutum FP-91666 SS1]